MAAIYTDLADKVVLVMRRYRRDRLTRMGRLGLRARGAMDRELGPGAGCARAT